MGMRVRPTAVAATAARRRRRRMFIYRVIYYVTSMRARPTQKRTATGPNTFQKVLYW